MDSASKKNQTHFCLLGESENSLLAMDSEQGNMVCL